MPNEGKQLNIGRMVMNAGYLLSDKQRAGKSLYNKIGDKITPERIEEPLSSSIGTIDQYIQFNAISTPSTPIGNLGKLYHKTTGSDTKIFFLDSSGSEKELLSQVGTISSLGDVDIDELQVNDELILSPSAVTNITAVGGITVTDPIMRIQGNGGAIDITANPQIVAGSSGEIVLLHGNSDTNTITLENGTGLHLHQKAVLGNDDFLLLTYNSTDSQWQEISRNFNKQQISFSFSSRTAANGTYYFGGFYDFGASNNDFSPAITFGTVNHSYAAKFFIVTGAVAVGAINITIIGTSISNGTRVVSDTETITIPDTTVANSYFESTKYWLGQITVYVSSGTAINCNYGFCKYFNHDSDDFRVLGIDATWLGGAADTAPNIILRHHKTTGWTYNAGSTPTPPTALAAMATDHSTEDNTASNEEGSWQRTNLNTTITASNGEGIIFEVITTVNDAFVQGNIILTIRPN